MTVTRNRTKDWSGKPFGAPSPLILTKAWRYRRSLAAGTAYKSVLTLLGQDSVSAGSCLPGLPVYCGYYNGTFANLNAFRADFPKATYILSITPDGAKGARCIDCEPGDATPAGAALFVASNLPNALGGGRNDAGKPIVYCSAGDAQAVINAVAARGISRNQWLLFSAHWIGEHICGPGTCGYPAADATQYASNNAFDSDVFYAYCFGTVNPPTEWPLVQGSAFTADVKTLQENLNRWAVKLNVPAQLIVDGNFGPLTAAAVTLAEIYFGIQGEPAGVCTEALFNDLKAAVEPLPPPPPPPFTYEPVTGLRLLGAGPGSVKFQFTAGTQPHPGLAKFQVSICEGASLGPVIGSYPRYIDFVATGTYEQQWGATPKLKPNTTYTLAVRGMAQDGQHAAEWALLRFKTAP